MRRLREIPHRMDRLHLGNEARMEDDLANAPAYRPCVRWKVVDPVRQELHDDEIVAEAAMNHRPERGIAAVAAIPIMFTIDLHRSEELRKRCRREQSIDRHIAVR